MAITAVNSYLAGTLWLNCRGGGYSEKYNLNTTDAIESQNVMRCIAKLRAALMERYTRIANCVISVVQPVGTNPADGLQIPHSIFLGPSLMTAQLPALPVETVAGSASDPANGILWKLDTGIGYQENRLLRSIRQSWVVNGQLVVTGVSPLAPGSPTTAAVLAANYATVDPGVALSNYFSYVRDNTCFVQRTPTLATKFNKITFASQFITPGNGPDWKVIRISKKTVGYGWPKVAGRQPAFA